MLQSAEKRQPSRAKLIIATGFGNFLENFDFTVYSYFATIIGLVVLKTDDPLLATYISSVLFGLGFLARPLGSVILGAYADRHGRKAALSATLLLMGLGSAFIAFAPSYAVAGLGAALLIVLGRLIQGFSAGGETGTASTLLLESARAGQSGLFVGWQFAMQGISAAAGALCAYALFRGLSPEALHLWGWRAPFLFALLIIPAGLYLRSHITDSYRGSRHSPETALAAHPLRQILAQHGLKFFLAVIMVMPITLLVYGIVLYLPTYLSLIRIESGAATLTQGSGRFMVTAAMGLAMAVAALSGGALCDRLPRRKPLMLGCLMLVFCSLFAVYACVGSNFVGFLAALLLSVVTLGVMMPVQALLVMEAFPRPLRASGIAVSLSVGSCLFGGTAQAILTKLMMVSHADPLSPFYYIGPMLLIAMAVYAVFKEERHP